MNEHMNPDYPKQRGCFMDENTENNTFKVVDYPTWTSKNGRWFPGANDAISDGNTFEKTFSTKDDALNFCAVENYVICSYPKTDEELAEIRSKREAFWANQNADENDAFDDAFDF